MFYVKQFEGVSPVTPGAHVCQKRGSYMLVGKAAVAQGNSKKKEAEQLLSVSFQEV